MQFPHLSRILAIPFIFLLLLFFLPGIYESETSDLYLLIPSIFGLVLLYVFNEEIDHWWWSRRPPPLENKIRQWLNHYSPFYRALDIQLRERFEVRLSLFIRLKNFTLKEKRDFEVPEDLKTLIAHEYIRITLQRSDFLFKDYNHFILYNHPFGSPQYNFLHSLELFHEDGVVILSREQLITGFYSENAQINLGLFAAITTFLALSPRLLYPEVSDISLEDMEHVFPIKIKLFKATLGFDWINKLEVLIYCYFEFPGQFNSEWPDKYDKLSAIFMETV